MNVKDIYEVETSPPPSSGPRSASSIFYVDVASSASKCTSSVRHVPPYMYTKNDVANRAGTSGGRPVYSSITVTVNFSKLYIDADGCHS